MGDDKYYTIQIKGTAYRFRPVTPEAFERIALVQSMSVDQAKVIKAVSQALSTAAMGDAWDKITDRWVSGELTTEQATVGILKTLVDRQKEEKKKPKGEPATADDAE